MAVVKINQLSVALKVIAFLLIGFLLFSFIVSAVVDSTLSISFLFLLLFLFVFAALKIFPSTRTQTSMQHPAFVERERYSQPIEHYGGGDGFCTNCGSPLNRGDQFCGACGKRLR